MTPIQRTQIDASPEFETLLALLDEQREALMALDLARPERRALMASQDASGLLALLARRDAMVARLGMAARSGRAAQRQWESSPQPEWRLREVQQRLDMLTAMHARVLEGDIEDQSLLAARREEIARELAGVANGRKANGAYADHLPGGARFQDINA